MFGYSERVQGCFGLSFRVVVSGCCFMLSLRKVATQP